MSLKSVADAAIELSISKGTLYSLVRQRRIPHVKIGDRILLDLEKVVAALEIPANGMETSNRPLVLRTKGHR